MFYSFICCLHASCIKIEKQSQNFGKSTIICNENIFCEFEMKFSFFYACVSSLLSSCCVLNIWKSCSDLISLCSPCWNIPVLPPCFLLRNSVSSLIQSIDESYVWLIVLFISSVSALFIFLDSFLICCIRLLNSFNCLYSLGIQLGIHLLFFDFFEHTHNHFLSSLPEFFQIHSLWRLLLWD